MITLPKDRRSALITGSIYYFTGKPCKWGHIASRYTNSGKCAECHKIHQKKWYENHPEKAALNAKNMHKKRMDNPIKKSEFYKNIKQWQQNNLDKVLKNSKKSNARKNKTSEQGE